MKRIILLATVVVIAISGWGQTNYYSQTKTFEGLQVIIK